MANPWGKRSIKRLFLGIGIMIALIALGGTNLDKENITLGIIFMLSAFLSPIIMPLYFKFKENSGKKKCGAVILSNFSETPTFTVEAWHPYSEWGFLSVTNKSVVFIPKKGNVFHESLEDITNYGSDFIGTGEYVTTTTRLPNTNLNISGSREAKVPVFYVDVKNERTYWQVRKNNKFFQRIEKAYGIDRKTIKANF